MEYHLGRVLDHVHVRVRDLGVSRRFYEAALGALGREVRGGEGYFQSDELFVSDDGMPTQNMHIAFQTDGPEAVARFYDAALARRRTRQRPARRAPVPPRLLRRVRARSGREQRRGGLPRPGDALCALRRAHASRLTPGGDVGAIAGATRWPGGVACG